MNGALVDAGHSVQLACVAAAPCPQTEWDLAPVAASIYFAVCEAVAAARCDAGLPPLSGPLPLPPSVAVVQHIYAGM